LTQYSPKAILVSSDSNPEEVAFAAVACSLNIATIFVSHAFTSAISPPLDFSLSLLEGKASIDAFRRKGVVKGEVFLLGLEGCSVPLDLNRFDQSTPVIGIFATKTVNWPMLESVIRDCHSSFNAVKILIRWHPDMLYQPDSFRRVQNLPKVELTPQTSSLSDVALRCDWVIAPSNSHVHLPILKLGIPSIAISHLSVSTDERMDLYDFLENNLVYPVPATLKELSLQAVKAFYAANWSEKFYAYDAAYLKNSTDLEVEALAVIRRVVNRKDHVC